MRAEFLLGRDCRKHRAHPQLAVLSRMHINYQVFEPLSDDQVGLANTPRWRTEQPDLITIPTTTTHLFQVNIKYRITRRGQGSHPPHPQFPFPKVQPPVVHTV